MSANPILVTGAAGRVGSVGFKIVELLRRKGFLVRAMVRQLDERSRALEELGAEIVVGDLTNLSDIQRALRGCSRVYFGMGVSDSYLEAALNFAVIAKHIGVEILVNISQMTVSQMNIEETTESHHQKYHWLVEQVLNWSGIPVVHLRSTVFLEHPFFLHSISESNEIRLPFGRGFTSPISSFDVARVAAKILESPQGHAGKVYELTGPKSQDMDGIASEYSKALHHEIKYVDVPIEEWERTFLKSLKVSPHLANHLLTMAKLHRANRYHRFTNDVEMVTGETPMTIEQWVTNNIQLFQK